MCFCPARRISAFPTQIIHPHLLYSFFPSQSYITSDNHGTYNSMGHYGYAQLSKTIILEANSHETIATGWIADSMETSAPLIYQ
jgi:hypothetical protein